MILLIADSGSTKTDWVVVAPEQTIAIQTPGINPVHQDDTTIDGIIGQGLIPQLGGVIPSHIHFYGAGCIGNTTNQRLSAILHRHFAATCITVESDLLGAAHSLCGRKPGIAGILGTGANSCYYDGKQIVANTPPLGYILGDEGSGASLGKNFLRALLRKELGEDLLNEFYTSQGIDYPTLIQRIYREPAANRYLASLSPFIASHLHHEAVQHIVADTFTSYLRNHIMHYDYCNTPLHLTGSIAYHYRHIIAEVAHGQGITIGTITRTPIEGLIMYHTNNL